MQAGSHSIRQGHFTKEGDECIDQKEYQAAVGGLLYLSTKTRPDISFAVGNVARFCSHPTQVHWTAIKRIMRELKILESSSLEITSNRNASDTPTQIGVEAWMTENLLVPVVWRTSELEEC